MKTAVETVFVGRDRQYNRRFLQMCSHYLVEPVDCTPASGWEKGQVENQVGLVRERFFTPRLRFKTYDDSTPGSSTGASHRPRPTRIPNRAEQNVWEVFEEERPKLIAYRGRFDGFHAHQASVSKTCLVRFDNNHYSVDASAVGRPVDVQPTPIVSSFARMDGLSQSISEKQARSIRYQLTTAKLPLAKDVNDFAFKDTPINENLVRDLAGGVFVAQQRNVVLVGGTGTGKTHLAIAIARVYPRGLARPLLQHCRSRQPARSRGSIWPSRAPRRLSHAARLHRSRLVAIFRLRSPVARPVPPDQPSLRTHVDHRHNKSRLR